MRIEELYGYLVREDGMIFNLDKTPAKVVMLNTYRVIQTPFGLKHVARMVAECFCEGMNKERDDKIRNTVNHIDENRTNDHYTNLEWVSQKENNMHNNRHLRVGAKGGKTRKTRYAKEGLNNNEKEGHSKVWITRRENEMKYGISDKVKEGHRKSNEANGHDVVAIDLEGKEYFYPSMVSCAKALGVGDGVIKNRIVSGKLLNNTYKIYLASEYNLEDMDNDTL